MTVAIYHGKYIYNNSSESDSLDFPKTNTLEFLNGLFEKNNKRPTFAAL